MSNYARLLFIHIMTHAILTPQTTYLVAYIFITFDIRHKNPYSPKDTIQLYMDLYKWRIYITLYIDVQKKNVFEPTETEKKNSFLMRADRS